MAKKLNRNIVKDVHGGQGDAWIKELYGGSFIVVNKKGEDLANFRFEDFDGAVKWTVLQGLNLPAYKVDERGCPIIST